MVQDESDRGVRLERDGTIAIMTIDRPSRRNALDLHTIQEMTSILDDLIGAQDISVLCVRGAGDRAFIAGGDLKDLASIRDLEKAEFMAMTMRTLLDRLSALPFPVVGVINGDAYGGGAEVAMACDFRVASDHVHLAFNQIRLGIIPAWGGIERLTTLVGPARSMYLLTTGKVLNASQAMAWNLVEEVFPKESFEKQWHSFVREIATHSSGAVRRIKEVVSATISSLRPNLSSIAIRSFAETWVADDHWNAAAQFEQTRNKSKMTI